MNLVDPHSIADVAVALPSAGEVIRVLLFQSGFNTSLVILGATLLGIASGIVGIFALLRKRALMGDALAHASLPGLCAAFIVLTLLGRDGRNLPLLLLGATASGVIGVLAVQLLSRSPRVSEDAAIGSVLSVFFGAGVVLLSVVQALGSGGGLNHFIYGQTAAMQWGDALLLAGLALTATLSALLFLKEFGLVAFDREFASVQGWPVQMIDLLLMALVTVVTIIGLQTVGLILIVSLLIIPPAAARFWTERLPRMVILSGILGGASGYLGAAVSALLPRLPAGSVIVLTAGTFFLVSFLFAPRRGVIAGTWKLVQSRRAVLRDHVLRGIFESCERRGVSPKDTAVPIDSVPLLRNQPEYILRRFANEGLVAVQRGTVALTARGHEEALRRIRNHRLWEVYLVTHADVAPSHVDYSADFVEHVLSPELIAKLEAEIAPRDVPRSIHPLEEAQTSREVPQ